MTTKKSPLEPLKHRGFLIYWLAGLSANFGWQIQLVGASWLMISLGGTPEQVAFVQTSVALPVMLLSLPGGTLSDRLGQRVLVLWTQSFLMLISIALAAAAWFGVLTPTLLLLCTLLVGAGRALYYPGWVSMVFEFFPRERTAAAFAINTGNLNIARSLGPALGGVLVAALGPFVTFLTSALSNVSVLLVARKWRIERPAQELPPEPFGSAVMAGVRYIALSPVLLKVILRSFIFNVAAISVMALLPLVARDILQGGPQLYGLLLGAFGVGAVMAAVLSEGIRARIPLETYVALSFIAFAAATAIMAINSNIALTVAASTLAGVCWILAQVTFGSLNQVASPRWVISRSIAIYQTAVFGGNALGSLLWGVLAAMYGTQVSLLVAAGMMAAGALIGLVLRIGAMDTRGLDPLSEWVAPEPRVNIVQQSGPILTTITYRIREADVPQFLEIMGHKRRNRRRDGAMRWTLSRDILEPEIWLERFKVATWAEAQRLHARRTVESGRVIEAVRNLHQGPGRPEVHYELVRHPGRSGTELGDRTAPTPH